MKYKESFVIAQDGEILISRVTNHLHWKFQDYKIFLTILIPRSWKSGKAITVTKVIILINFLKMLMALLLINK